MMLYTFHVFPLLRPYASGLCSSFPFGLQSRLGWFYCRKNDLLFRQPKRLGFHDFLYQLVEFCRHFLFFQSFSKHKQHLQVIL